MSIDSAHALRVEVARLTKERDEARAGLHRAEVELRVSGAAYGSLQDSLTVARLECEGLRKALRESRRHIVAGRRFAGLSDDGPEVRRIDAALAGPAPAPGEET